MPHPPFKSLIPLLLLGVLVFYRGDLRAQEAADPLPLVEDFETLTKGMPAGWTNDSFGEVSVQLAGESRRAHEGKSCWKVLVPAWEAGAARVRRGGLPLKEGANYAVEVWLRAEGVSAPVEVALRGKAGEEPYLSRRFAVGPEWRRCTLEGRCPVANPNGALTLALPGSGTLYIDGLRLIQGELPVEPEPVSPPAVKGNRIFNSSFELGADGWTIPEQFSLVKTECPDGERFARWLPGRFPLEARPFFARPNQEYTVSAYLRSQRPGAKARLSLVEIGNEVRETKAFALSTEWKRYSFTARLPCIQNQRYFVVIGPDQEPHGIDVDAVQVEEGPLTAYRPAADLEISHGLGRAQLFPQPDEVLGVPVQVYARDKVSVDTTLHYRLEGFYGETLFRSQAPVKEGLTYAEVPVRVRIPQAGPVRLVVEATVAREVVSRSEVLLTALPAPDPKPNPRSFFGAHGTVGTAGEWHAPTIAARAGIRWWRLHDLSAFTQWAVAEPQRGRYVWYDREIAGLRSRGLSVLGVLARTAPWAGQDPGGERADPSAWPPAQMSDFTEYVKQVVGHYRGQIAAYEIWNEPWARSFWAGSPEQYAELARAASEAARAADPNVTLVGGCFWVPQPGFTNRVLAKDFLPIVNAVSHHQYTEPISVTYTYGGRDQVTQWNQNLRGKLSLVGGDKEPIWNTEGGMPCPSFYSWLGAAEASRSAARALAKTLVLNRAAGVQRYFYYHVWQELGPARLFDWTYVNNWALLDYDGSGKPTLGALAGCAQRLEGAEPAGRVETAAVKAYLFRKGANTVVAAWSPTALTAMRELSLKVNPARVRAFNLMGNPKGVRSDKDTALITMRDEPVYLEIAQTSPAAVQDALQKAAGISKETDQ